ncbi:unnamed protein product [Schistocephalus solidus]|uniref:Reverse transcriptase domain-containing protein n=1 Tax=Schistocephalus solidus TaxID=70667 RepID=A0A183T347_SCHSO|nr:unnamed protein product [Schistocephalus solidus]
MKQRVIQLLNRSPALFAFSGIRTPENNRGTNFWNYSVQDMESDDADMTYSDRTEILMNFWIEVDHSLRNIHGTPIQQSRSTIRQVSQEFKDATIVHLYKRKENRQICDTHRGISLLNIAGKIFARVLLNRLNGHLEQGLLPESQCGFRRYRGTTDMIFAARQLQENGQEM